MKIVDFNDKLFTDKIYAFNHFKQVYHLSATPLGSWNFYGLFASNKYWLIESLNSMESCVHSMMRVKEIYEFDNQSDFLNWSLMIDMSNGNITTKNDAEYAKGFSDAVDSFLGKIDSIVPTKDLRTV